MLSKKNEISSAEYDHRDGGVQNEIFILEQENFTNSKEGCLK